MERSHKSKMRLNLRPVFVPRRSFVVVFFLILLLTACGGGGNKSATGSAPVAPTNLTATAVSTSQINLSWTASPGATSYNVVSSTANSGPTIVTGVSTTSYSNTGLTASTAYHYEVQAVNSYGTSGGSNRASATTQGPPTLVQINAADPGSTQPPIGVASVQVTYANEQNAGDLNIVAVPCTNFNMITSVTDSSGNTYNLAIAPTAADLAAGACQAIYYASNIKAAPAGANTVTVTWSFAIVVPDVRILEYLNVDTLDQTASADGTSASESSGSVTTTVANELLFGTGYGASAAGSGFTAEMFTWDGAIVEDEIVSEAGSYAATATGYGSGWDLQLATFYLHTGAAPTSLTATAASSSQNNLSWTASSGATSYNVLRSTVSGGPYTQVNTTGTVTTTGYSDTGLSSATMYYYVVRAVNSGGTSSGNSNQALAVTQGTPTAPTWLMATAASTSQINLSWTAPAGATSYNVLSSTTSGGPYTSVASGVTGTSYANTGLTAGITYYYVVEAVNSGAASGNSNQASATTQGGPAVPTGLAAAAVSTSQINLNWMAASGATSYNVLSSTTSGGPYTQIASGVTGTSYANTGLTAGIAYYYVVEAVNSNATSGNSNPASATTLAASANMPTVFYASPTGSGTACTSASPCSLTGAQAQVQAVNSNMSSNIIVYLEGGTYDLSTNPFTLTNADSGTNGFNVIYEALPGAMPVFEGGYSVPAGSWTLYNSSSGIYAANVGTLEARQIYVNGQRAVRARSPNLTDPVTLEPYSQALNAAPPFQVQASPVVSGLSTAPNLNQVGAPEMVYIAHFTKQIGRIANFQLNGSTATVNFMASDAFVAAFMTWTYQLPTYFYFENAYQLLDAPGEFFLDLTVNPHVLYYIPLSGQSMSSATVTVPVAQSVVKMIGSSPSTPITNIQLMGITFQDTNWTLPDNCGYFDWQEAEQELCADASGNITSQEIPGAVYIAYGQNITLQNNTFQHTGAHGLLIQVSNNVQVLNNIFTDLSAGGVFIDGNALVGGTSPDDTNDNVQNNLVDSFGQYYTDAAGMFMDLGVANTSWQYNEIRYGRYTGLGPGEWEGAYGVAGMNNMDNITIQNNKIHNVMELHDDGAGIYTAGDTPNMLIQNNYIYSITPSAENGGNSTVGIYLDADAGDKTTQNNVLDNVNMAFNGCPNPYEGGDAFTDNYYNENIGAVSCDGNTVTGNTYVTGEEWPSAAQAIINGAGIQ